MSYTFDGSSTYLKASAFPVSSVGSVTLVAWVRHTAYNATLRALVQAVNAGSYARELVLYKRGTTGRVQAAINDGTSEVLYDSTLSISNGVWMLYAAVFSEFGGVLATYGYYNYNGSSDTGLVIGSATKTPSPWPNITVIGAAEATSTPTYSGYFAGDIAHVAIYNTALSEEELDAMQTTAPPNVNIANCAVYWPLLTDATPAIGDAGTYTLSGTASLNGGVGPSITLYGGSTVSPRATLLGVGR